MVLDTILGWEPAAALKSSCSGAPKIYHIKVIPIFILSIYSHVYNGEKEAGCFGGTIAGGCVNVDLSRLICKVQGMERSIKL